MKFAGFAATIGATLALHSSIVFAKHSHTHPDVVDRRHRHHHNHQEKDANVSDVESGHALELRTSSVELEKRGGQCQFPTNAGLVSVTPDQPNAGWAMSPNQPCLPGNYCPYACPSGQMMAQWDPKATSYTYPLSMNGGLYCDNNGNIQKPFPNQPYCMGGTTSIGALNKAGKIISFCQTVLPGNEAMLIPTAIEEWEQLTIPNPDYWCGTAAHFYINPPGVDTDTACVWGTNQNPWGNWSPYVAGGNTDNNGNTFIKLAWNPIYLEPATPFRNVMPTWGVEIVCDGPGCNGLPCAIDPSRNQINEMVGSNTDGAGGANFCVVTVPTGVNANFVVFDGALGSAGGDTGASSPSPSPSPSPSSSAAPSRTPTPSSSAAPSSSSVGASSAVGSSTSGTITSSSSSSAPSFAYSPHVLLQLNMTSSYVTASTMSFSAQSTAAIGSGSGSTSTVSPVASASATAASAGYRSHITATGFGLSLFAAAVAIAF